MFRMYYISSVSPGVTDQDYEDILAKARRNNAELGITGLLIVKGNNFAQALEGEKEAVLGLYEKIKHDDRHRRIVLISQRDVESRIFPNWEMGFHQLEESEDFPGVDLNDPKFVSSPAELDQCFCQIIELQPADMSVPQCVNARDLI